ncbi:hypothetical protein ITJ54_07090 [Curtobacterium sp. VKM Ac-2865]|nr:hypothetical protein [Curtobacterium sp. VKM Ac-2865]
MATPTDVAPLARTDVATAPCPNASALSTAISRLPVNAAKYAVFARIASSWTTSSDGADISRPCRRERRR